jgi:hypothetical protein
MRIEHPRATPTAAQGAQSDSAPHRDRVSLSGELRLVGAALQAAASRPDVRPEAVGRARALLERGELGTDLHKLAESLLNSLVEGDDERA